MVAGAAGSFAGSGVALAGISENGADHAGGRGIRAGWFGISRRAEGALAARVERGESGGVRSGHGGGFAEDAAGGAVSAGGADVAGGVEALRTVYRRARGFFLEVVPDLFPVFLQIGTGQKVSHRLRGGACSR